MKKLLLLLFIIVSSSMYSQQKSNTVMIKSIETYGSFASMDKVLHVIDEEGKMISVDLSKHNKKGIPVNMRTIKKYIDLYLNKGYNIISSESTSFGWNGVFTIEHTYILKK